MSRRIVQVIVVAAGLILLAGVATAAYLNLFLSRLEVTDFFLFLSTIVLFVFLLTLVVRYLVLLLLAFVQHLRHLREIHAMDDMVPVTVIIPAYNEGKVIEASVRSVMNTDYSNVEAIVVDDGSSDDTREKVERMIEEYGPRLRLLAQPNSGKATALNHGIAHARGEVIMSMDGDSRLEPATIGEGVKHFDDPAVGAVAGNVKVANRLNLLTRLQALEYVEGLNLVRSAQALVHRPTVIPGPVGFFRRAVLEEVGGYHADTFSEDCELTIRIMLAGWKIKYEPGAVAWTEAPEKARALFQQRYRWGRGILQAIAKHRRELLRPLSNPLNCTMLWMLLFESVALPAMDIIGMLVFIFAGLTGGLSPLIVLWWVQLAILDTVIALFCVAVEREDIRLPMYAVLYRLYFVPLVDVMRFFAAVDELFDVRMGWLRLQRFGRI